MLVKSKLNVKACLVLFLMRSCFGTVLYVSYIAENNENFHQILVYFMATGAISGVNIEAKVPASLLPHQLEPDCKP